jgi:hypothetical protein
MRRRTQDEFGEAAPAPGADHPERGRAGRLLQSVAREVVHRDPVDLDACGVAHLRGWDVGE